MFFYVTTMCYVFNFCFQDKFGFMTHPNNVVKYHLMLMSLVYTFFAWYFFMARTKYRGRSHTTLTRRGGWVVQKCWLFVNIHKVENVNEEGVGGQKKTNYCQRTGSTIKNCDKVYTWLDQIFWQIYQKLILSGFLSSGNLCLIHHLKLFWPHAASAASDRKDAIS
jgi:hypothetical protein